MFVDKLTNDPASVNHFLLYELNQIFCHVAVLIHPNQRYVLVCIYENEFCKTMALCHIYA